MATKRATTIQKMAQQHKNNQIDRDSERQRKKVWHTHTHTYKASVCFGVWCLAPHPNTIASITLCVWLFFCLFHSLFFVDCRYHRYFFLLYVDFIRGLCLNIMPLVCLHIYTISIWRDKHSVQDGRSDGTDSGKVGLLKIDTRTHTRTHTRTERHQAMRRSYNSFLSHQTHTHALKFTTIISQMFACITWRLWMRRLAIML